MCRLVAIVTVCLACVVSGAHINQTVAIQALVHNVTLGSNFSNVTSVGAGQIAVGTIVKNTWCSTTTSCPPNSHCCSATTCCPITSSCCGNGRLCCVNPPPPAYHYHHNSGTTLSSMAGLIAFSALMLLGRN